MLSCDNYKALISALIDDEISDADRVSLMAHLVECEECRLYWEDQIAIHEAVADLTAAAPAGFTESVMARVRVTKQEQVRKVISFPKRFAGLAACCAVVILGIFAANHGMLTMDDFATADSAAPEMAYSLPCETQAADTAAPVAESESEESATPPAAAGGEARVQSDTDNGACVADSSATYTEYADFAQYAARITTGSAVAAQWVEETLGQTWSSGTCYLLTAGEYTELVSLLESSGESFEILNGTDNCEFYQLLAQ